MYVGKSVPFPTNECITATYSDKDGTNIQVDNQAYDVSEEKFGNWRGGTPPVGGPNRYFTAHCSDFTTGHCQVKPFFFAPYNDYKVVGFDGDQTNGYSIVYGCDTFIAGAIKLDWMWVITRQALVIGSGAWTTMKTTVFDIIRQRLPDYDPDTFLLETVEGGSCQYTPCTGLE